ncbi:conserved Plasmodium protein, unknown function [Plasmodium yoelii]|uniref:Uncharacterized protein n=3 Tax=Plasmodium yoelii TaxID=5861 RepID=A0AAE9WY10_PLAYO|nr:conserved Plasmodium protein, unknown function [Plasmodium yoelii]EAA22729.1 hypothetical protein [Plasmodium yoelii yoelii]WBY58508.1 hypothetical protein Py17XNL_001105893 [Plasmodium yoelii yoelii]CDU18823.1 conserved Plasmodium protein, unknown function [Plasmodium yoelii]VTZ79408.1 conserved Plasmodium protein, unknown function [Plasmodium yoelii]|eukprot:XP_731164.1 conserved Plasmodium protein, unknown function [Plasmodium yoelii]
MNKLKYTNKCRNAIKLGNNGTCVEQSYHDKDKTISSKERTYYSQVKWKNSCASLSKVKEQKSGYNKIYCYKDNKIQYGVCKNHKTNGYILLTNVSIPYNLKGTHNNNMNKTAQLNSEINKHSNKNENIFICNICYYINEMNEQMKKKKKQTTVYNLEFNNLSDYQNDEENTKITKTNKTNYIHMLNNNCQQIQKDNKIIEEKYSKHSPSIKKNLFKFLNSLFSMN